VVTQLKDINSGVPQGNVLGPMLIPQMLYTADLSVALSTATYADDTAIPAAHTNYIEAFQHLQESLFLFRYG